jgi:hypothetical protein
MGCLMMKEIVLASVLLVAAAIAARADETGLASIHDWRKESGKVCMSEHFHDGSGVGETRKAAEANAAASWASFTVLEYGSTWGSYALSSSKKMDCKQQGAKEWSCAVTSRPCKPAGVAKAKARKVAAH